ncbi:transcriptional regulator, GntR family [Marvinbryantia formatexigens DSM 14469]|uniref:Transcriptional regulator, GntR family n=1 Tax=Marvinbryantia formatexigens DSM 14469 TaxID=478749 RepID=C6L970_9FIRM|nr:GntR family transcriptional regulator [Marvinbryantia formatexigens]EET62809.1 transcriptional regulator, GntR family [Marvinbryantia formatexigens DSM 14469]UWO23159.1 GntR family transcriptional regulator [Marvinbryantia formatexigens DSM 14469]SDG01797.1 DNA-binding transcriptional regulator, GntR family [Marvinbryantia formatexigens]
MRLLERYPRENGREYALRVIKNNIIRLELAPGSRVSEKNLADEMGLSRTPVREALIELARGGIVEIYPQRGSVVSLIDYSLVEEARFMRGVMENAVIKLVCEMASPADILKLGENLKLQEFYLDSADNGRLMELDDEFHKLLFDIAQKSRSYLLMQNLTLHFDRVRNMALSAVKELKIVQDHQAIVEAVRRHDAAEAGALMETHLSRYRIDEEAIRRKYDAKFFK